MEECQDTGREGPGAAPLHTVVANQQENPSATSNAATAAAAKIVLGAAGVTPQTLSEQKSIDIGGAKIKVKRPAFIQPIGEIHVIYILSKYLSPPPSFHFHPLSLSTLPFFLPYLIGNMMKAFSSSFRTKTSALKIDEEKSYRKAQSPEPKLETIPSPRAQSLPVGGGAAKVTTKSTTTTSTFTVKTSFAGVSLGSKLCKNTHRPSLHPVKTPNEHILSTLTCQHTPSLLSSWSLTHVIIPYLTSVCIIDIFTMFMSPSISILLVVMISFLTQCVYYSLYVLSLSTEPLGQQLCRQYEWHRFPRPCRLPYCIVCFCSHSSNPCSYHG